MSDPPPFPTRRLLVTSAVAGVIAGSTASALAAFEIGVGLLAADGWVDIVDAGRPAIIISSIAGIAGGLLYGLVIGMLARPLARIPSPTGRRILYSVLFTAGFVAYAGIGLATGAPPLRPVTAALVVAVAFGCAWISVPGFDRERST